MTKSIDFYNNNAQSFFENTINVDMTEFYDEFIPYLAQNSTILDARCGSGRGTKYFLELGFDVTAFDASMVLVELASKATQIDVKCMTLNDINWIEKFSGIWACASLLHLDDFDLKSAFSKLFKSLNTHGVIYCSFKYGEIKSVISGQYFNNKIYLTLTELLSDEQNIVLQKTWITNDKRLSRSDEKWLNIIIKKD